MEYAVERGNVGEPVLSEIETEYAYKIADWLFDNYRDDPAIDELSRQEKVELYWREVMGIEV